MVEAAGEPGDAGRRHLIYESADLIYHLLVMLAYSGVKLEEVEREIGADEIRRQLHNEHILQMEEQAKRILDPSRPATPSATTAS